MRYFYTEIQMLVRENATESLKMLKQKQVLATLEQKLILNEYIRINT